MGPVCRYWPPAAIAWAEGIRRRNDKLIAKWLWLDEWPLRQVEIAKRLKISRAAVSQRRKLLLSELRRLHPDVLMEQDHVPETLNIEGDYDWSLEDLI